MKKMIIGAILPEIVIKRSSVWAEKLSVDFNEFVRSAMLHLCDDLDKAEQQRNEQTQSS